MQWDISLKQWISSSSTKVMIYVSSPWQLCKEQWQDNSLPSVQCVLWCFFSVYFVLTTDSTDRPWLTFSGTFSLVLTLRSCWLCLRLTALMLPEEWKINLSDSELFQQHPTMPCIFHRMDVHVSLKEWQSSSADLHAKSSCVSISPSHGLRRWTAPGALLTPD